MSERIEKPDYRATKFTVEMVGMFEILRDAINAQAKEIEALKYELKKHAGPGHAEPDLRGLL